MLNPKLYASLGRMFGQVSITKPGQCAESFVETDLSGRTRTRWRGGEFYRVNCPYCGDTKQRLYVSHRFGVYDVEVDSMCLSLARCFHNDCFVEDKSRWTSLYNEVYLFNGGSIRSDQLEPGTPYAPPEFVDMPGRVTLLSQLSASHSAWEYLRDERHFAPEVLLPYGLAYCYEASEAYPLMNNRLVIPIAFNGKCVGWQGRTLRSNTKRIKYFNWPEFRKSKCLYNYDTARQWLLVVVVEGVTDVWRVGPPPGFPAEMGSCAVASFGSLCDDQIPLLSDLLHDGFVVVLTDGDHGGELVLKQLRERLQSDRLWSVQLPSGLDPGKLSHDQIWNQFLLPTLAAQGLSGIVGVRRPPRVSGETRLLV